MRTFDLASSYSREKFQNYLIDFLPDDYTTDVKPQYYDFTNIKEGFKLGQSEELDLSVFEFQIKSEHDPKITITKEVASLMKKYEYNSNALVVFYNKKSAQWRLSLITTDYEKKENKIIRQYSNPKRYSFLLGKDCKKHTPEKMLFKEHIHEHTENGKLITKQQDLKNRFALEVVGKEFFDEYKVFYEDFVQYITGNRYIKKGGKWEKVKIHEANNEIFNKFLKITNDNEKLAQKYVRDYIKKMMGRLVFLQFLQKKGWLGVENNAKWGTGDKNYIQNLFLCSNYKDDFLEQVLEPLFFGMLNTQHENRISLFKEKHYNLDLLTNFKRVPYLNGGLFESDNLDDIRIKFPKELFSNLKNDKERIFAGEIENYPYTRYCGLLDFFSRYNFTIDESDPSDTEIGVEPEMLGKIFENLLEDNKDKGAFYTPKEIVQYMCRESLISYLLSNSKIKEEHIRKFVLNHDNIEDFNNEEKKYLLEKLKNVTICDPAVGSGAFPMGLLNELYMCRIVLEPKESPLKIKKEIVQKNIYGVDIEKGAVDIARLRFWLAIIVDEKEPLPLPNLDFKIMQGNSLIESYKGRDLSCLKQDLFDDEEISKRLEEEIENYYNPNTQQNKHEISNEIKKHLTTLLKNNAIGEKGNTLLKDLEKIDLHANSEFFLWHTWFKPVFEKGGFDIVIGNPPYGAKISDEEKNICKKKYITTKTIKNVQKGSLDTYTLFIELGFNILKNFSNLTFIVPMSFTSSDSLSGTHKLLMDNCKKISVSSFAVRPEPVFKNAMVDTSIIKFIKTLTPCKQLFTTKLYRKKGITFSLQNLIDNLQFIEVKDLKKFGRIPKISNEIEKNILKKLIKHKTISDFIVDNGKKIYYRMAGGRYFKVITNYSTESSAEKFISLKKDLADVIGCLLSSNLSFWFYQIFSDNHNWKGCEITSFPVPIEKLSFDKIKEINELYKKYIIDIEKNANIRISSGNSSYNVSKFKEYKLVKSKKIIDEIDEVICPLYNLTKEEIEFIKNYELEFRMSGDTEK